MKPLSSEARGFTLTELLTAIAIVAVLSVILIAAVGNLRRSAVAAQCQSNLKAYGIAMLAYHSDYHTIPPLTDPDFWTKTQWTTALVPNYLPEVLRCPAGGERLKEDTFKANWSFNYAGSIGLITFYPRLRNIPAPAHKVVLASESFSAEQGVYLGTHLTMTLWGASEHASATGSFKEGEGKDFYPQYHGSPGNRGLHLFFLDGHIELVRPKDGDFLKEPTYGNGINDGYYYDVRQFQYMHYGWMTF